MFQESVWHLINTKPLPEELIIRFLFCIGAFSGSKISSGLQNIMLMDIHLNLSSLNIIVLKEVRKDCETAYA